MEGCLPILHRLPLSGRGSAGSPPRSPCCATASPTSRSSRRPTTSAVSGVRTRTPARPATCPRTSTPSRTSSTVTGAGRAHRTTRSTTTCWRPRTPSASRRASGSPPRSRVRRGTRRRCAGAWTSATGRPPTPTSSSPPADSSASPRSPRSQGPTRSPATSSTPPAGTTAMTSPAATSPSSGRVRARCSSSRPSPSRPGTSTCSSARRTTCCHGATCGIAAPVRAAIKHVPGVQAARRQGMLLLMETMVHALKGNRAFQAVLRTMSRALLHRHVRDRELRRKLTPSVRVRVQAHPLLVVLLPRADPRQRRARRLPDHADHGRRGRDQRRRRSTPPIRSSGARASTPRRSSRRWRSPAPTAGRSPTPGPAARTPTTG